MNPMTTKRQQFHQPKPAGFSRCDRKINGPMKLGLWRKWRCNSVSISLCVDICVVLYSNICLKKKLSKKTHCVNCGKPGVKNLVTTVQMTGWGVSSIGDMTWGFQSGWDGRDNHHRFVGLFLWIHHWTFRRAARCGSATGSPSSGCMTAPQKFIETWDPITDWVVFSTVELSKGAPACTDLFGNRS